MSDDDQPPEKHDPLAALRQPNFIKYTSARSFAIMGSTLLQAVIAWQVYEISGSALNLGLLGLVRFLPALGMSLVGGAAADTYNRRVIVILAQTVPLTSSIILALATFGDWVELEMIYFIVLLLGLASAFEGPATVAILPGIVKPETFSNAVTVSVTLQSLGRMIGPALAGGLIAVAGVATAYSFYVVVLLCAITPLLLLRYKQAPSGRERVTFESIREGVRFVRSRPVLLGAMSLDMFAVLFGGAQALLPIYAKDILEVGPVGYGLLYASIDIGAFAASVVLVMRPPISRTGRTLIRTVALFGLFTIGFGLSRFFPLSLLFYGLIGVADQISVVMRNTTIQLATPDELRGRVSAVSQVFVGASNQMGAMESGFVAALTSTTFAVVSGGVGAIGIASFIGLKNRELYEYRIPRAVRSETPARPSDAAAGTS